MLWPHKSADSLACGGMLDTGKYFGISMCSGVWLLSCRGANGVRPLTSASDRELGRYKHVAASAEVQNDQIKNACQSWLGSEAALETRSSKWPRGGRPSKRR